MNKKVLLLIALTIAAAVVMAADVPLKVSDDVGIRIKNVQLDQARIQTEMLQLQVRYTTDQNELTSLNKEALATAKLDDKKFTVDDEKLIFVPVPDKK